MENREELQVSRGLGGWELSQAAGGCGSRLGENRCGV